MKTSFLPLLLPLAIACSSESDDSPSSPAGDAGPPPTSAPEGGASDDSGAIPDPGGPVADVSEEITGANGPFIGAADWMLPAGYVDQEFVAAGDATSYRTDDALDGDGTWTFEPDGTAPYRTRVLVRRPENASDFSGTVLVEWLNVSGGVDANPDYASLQEEIVRQGHAWVGVSAQLIGVEGGPVLVSAPGGEGLAGQGLKALDAERYGSLVHPGDGFAFDIYTQVARAARQGTLLSGAIPDRVVAVGESQSAIALVTYYNGVQPLTEAFDGFFVHSRGQTALPLVGPGEFADLAGAIGSAGSALLRTDLDAPALVVQTEGDLAGVLNSVGARQPDTDTVRLWEAAGTAHADRHLLGSLADGIDCGVPINDGPMHVIAKAAFRGLETWVRTGEAPVTSPRVEITDGPAPTVSRDADGIALGGIRTPPVDVPVDVLSGDPGPSATIICILMGTTTPLSEARIAELYTSRADYEQQYAAAADAAIQAGFVLEDDRDALMAYAQPDRVAP